MYGHETGCECHGCFTLGSRTLGGPADFGFGTMVADFPSRYAVRCGEERSDFLGVMEVVSENKMIIVGLLVAALGAFMYFRRRK